MLDSLNNFDFDFREIEKYENFTRWDRFKNHWAFIPLAIFIFPIGLVWLADKFYDLLLKKPSKTESQYVDSLSQKDRFTSKNDLLEALSEGVNLSKQIVATYRIGYITFSFRLFDEAISHFNNVLSKMDNAKTKNTYLSLYKASALYSIGLCNMKKVLAARTEEEPQLYNLALKNFSEAKKILASVSNDKKYAKVRAQLMKEVCINEAKAYEGLKEYTKAKESYDEAKKAISTLETLDKSTLDKPTERRSLSVIFTSSYINSKLAKQKLTQQTGNTNQSLLNQEDIKDLKKAKEYNSELTENAVKAALADSGIDGKNLEGLKDELKGAFAP